MPMKMTLDDAVEYCVKNKHDRQRRDSIADKYKEVDRDEFERLNQACWNGEEQ